MTTLLEERYRGALRLLPAAYRERWEEDMVATFLEGAYAAVPDDPDGVDVSRPSLAELLSVAALAVRVRLGGADATPRPRLAGDGVRLATLAGLLVHASGACLSVVLTGWVALRLPGSDVPPELSAWPTAWQVLRAWLPMLWLAAFMTVLYGHYRWARVLAWSAFAVEVVARAVDVVADGRGPTLTSWVFLLLSLVIVAGMSAFHGTAPRVRPRPWALALGATTGLQVAAALLVHPRVGDHGLVVLLDQVGLWCVVLVGVALARRVAGDRAPRWGSSRWTLALALLAGLLLVWRLVTAVGLIDLAGDEPGRAAEELVLAAELAAVALVAMVNAVYARRDWRLLPPAYTDLATDDDRDGH